MTDTIARTLEAALGSGAVRHDSEGRIRVEPPSPQAVAVVMGLAYDAHWRIAIEGAATWQVGDAPADAVISLRAMNQVLEFPAAEPSIRVQAGVPFNELRRMALEHGSWLALDPPGHTDRTIGSVLATGTPGPLRHHSGPVRDQVVSLTAVTGDGRVLQSTGNGPEGEHEFVRLHTGSFGAFGVITECTFRLHELPRADVTWVAGGHRDHLIAAARTLLERHVDLVALELMSPALATESDWLLAARLIGDRDAVAAEGRRMVADSGVTWRELAAERCALLWIGSGRAITSAPVTVRLGIVPDGIEDMLDLVVGHLGESMLSVGPATGSLRWSGTADVSTLRALRAQLASREVPVTIERAPWAIRGVLGHAGAYREEGGASAKRLRDLFDPRNVLLSALTGGEGA